MGEESRVWQTAAYEVFPGASGTRRPGYLPYPLRGKGVARVLEFGGVRLGRGGLISCRPFRAHRYYCGRNPGLHPGFLMFVVYKIFCACWLSFALSFLAAKC